MFLTSVKTRLERLEALDLTNVRRKLMEPAPEGKGWTEEEALDAEKWYRRYLAAIITYPKATRHVPNLKIDMFWHQHILDTEAYARDCKYVLGHFLHHYPYFGLNGDAAERDQCFEETDALYLGMFGETCKGQGSQCNSGGSGTGCGQGCGKGGKRSIRFTDLLRGLVRC